MYTTLTRKICIKFKRENIFSDFRLQRLFYCQFSVTDPSHIPFPTALRSFRGCHNPDAPVRSFVVIGVNSKGLLCHTGHHPFFVILEYACFAIPNSPDQ